MTKFVVCKSRDHDTGKRHYAQSEAAGKPWVIVETKTKYADVRWSCDTVYDRIETIRKQEKAINEKILAAFHRHASSKKSNYFFSAEDGSLAKLTPESGCGRGL